ncbi:MAG: S41 family peptidase [Flavipsychrobacter sp.]|nr:S41 family peptidase [Flavipsychrobacter sp.]
MKRIFKSSKGFIAGFALAATASLFIYSHKADSYFEISKNLDIYTSIFKELNSYYVDPIEPGKMIKTGIDAMLANLDPYTNYITESDIEEFEFQTTGKYGGIGANMRKKDDKVFVSDVYEYSPAATAGLKPGDEVISIDNQPLKTKTMEDISQLLKGSPGTQLSMLVKDGITGIESVKKLSRSEIELSSVPYAGLLGTNKNIAYVHLTQFTPACSRIIRSTLDSLKKVQPNLASVVLDLRNNPGGLLNEAVAICNLFVDRGQLVVSTKGKLPEFSEDFKTQGAVWDDKIPVAVLLNSSSASASEVVAGTLQDLDRAVVIGERSYGKGLVQVTKPVGYNARLKLTTAKYYTPSGRCIQAIDYGNRNPDGSVGFIPDSLKKEYKTKGGRRVFSGGGVDPDIMVPNQDISKLAITLYIKNYFFDYATQYVKEHKTIAPAGSFSLTDADYQQFAKWLDNKDYSYKTETEIALDSLKQIAMRDKVFDGFKTEYIALQQKASHDKKLDLQKNKAEVMRLLQNEIVTRYYYQRGRIENGLKSDEDFNKALSILAQPAQYQALLSPKK